jgi:hypothetical protein
MTALLIGHRTTDNEHYQLSNNCSNSGKPSRRASAVLRPTRGSAHAADAKDAKDATTDAADAVEEKGGALAHLLPNDCELNVVPRQLLWIV